MGRTLALVESGMAVARLYARKGRRNQALTQSLMMLKRADLNVPEAADAHRVAGECLLESERFARSRRHLRSSLALERGHARTWYLLGLAQERDPHGDDTRAARCFLRATRLAPENATYRAAFGRAAIRCDRLKRGVRELMNTVDAAVKDIAILEVVIDGLLDAGKSAEAQRIMVRARFSCPERGGIRRLQDRVKFESARRGQRRGSSTQDAGRGTDAPARLLPFLRVVRLDAASPSRPHLARLRSRSDR